MVKEGSDELHGRMGASRVGGVEGVAVIHVAEYENVREGRLGDGEAAGVGYAEQEGAISTPLTGSLGGVYIDPINT